MRSDTNIVAGVQNAEWQVAATLWLVAMWWKCICGVTAEIECHPWLWSPLLDDGESTWGRRHCQVQVLQCWLGTRLGWSVVVIVRIGKVDARGLRFRGVRQVEAAAWLRM